jgi:hypothetical protein
MKKKSPKTLRKYGWQVSFPEPIFPMKQILTTYGKLFWVYIGYTAILAHCKNVFTNPKFHYHGKSEKSRKKNNQKSC